MISPKDRRQFYWCVDPRYSYKHLQAPLDKQPTHRVASYRPIVTPDGECVAILLMHANKLKGVYPDGRVIDLPDSILKYCYPGISIRLRRKQCHLTQKRLAEILDCHEQAITKWERNPTVSPQGRIFATLQRVLGPLEWTTFPMVMTARDGRLHSEEV